MQVLRAAVTKFFPEADGEMRHACVCVFTNTPDSHFIIDNHPDHPQARLSSSGNLTRVTKCLQLALMRAFIFSNTSAGQHSLLAAQVIVCSACSGHGFKFASVIGECLADLAQAGSTRHDLSLHRLSRFLPRANL